MTDAALIERDVVYTIDLARYYPPRLRWYGASLEGAHIIELGPGRNFGLALILASYGARVTVADRFLSAWDDAYHPVFYRTLRDRWEGPSGAIDAALQSNSHAPVTAIPAGAEALDDIPSASVDAVISHAVLEHVFDFRAACRELARITKPGGVHIHQIDFRDHRDFSRPLEFLTILDDEFSASLRDRYWEQGNRWRPSEVLQAFQPAFSILSFPVDTMADDAYLNDFLPRLWASSSRYRVWPKEDLSVLGVRIALRRN